MDCRLRLEVKGGGEEPCKLIQPSLGNSQAGDEKNLIPSLVGTTI